MVHCQNVLNIIKKARLNRNIHPIMLLESKNLNKNYWDKDKEPKPALKDISLSFSNTGLVFILGESGSGKSTLLSIIGGLLKPTSGAVYFKGHSIGTMDDDSLSSYRFHNVVSVFQEYSFVEDLDVAENVLLGLGKRNTSIDESMREALRNVSLPGFENRLVSDLSGGERQRVSIARAILRNVEIILCDEPTSSLDEMTSANIFDILQTLSKNRLVIASCHDRDAAYRYGDRIIEIAEGKIIKDLTSGGESSEIFYSDDRIFVPKNHRITADELPEFNDNLFKRGATKVFAGPKSRHFETTKESKEEPAADNDWKKLHSYFSPSKRLSALSVAKRPKRFVIPSFLLGLTCGLFGTALVASSYSERTHSIETLSNAKLDYICLSKTADTGTSHSTIITDSDISSLSSFFDLPIMGVKGGSYSFGGSTGSIDITKDDYSSSSFSGLAEANEEFFTQNRFRLEAGSYPTNSDDIVISTEVADVVKRYGYRDLATYQLMIDYPNGGYNKNLSIGLSYEELIGKELVVTGFEGDKILTIKGIAQFSSDYSPYRKLLDNRDPSASGAHNSILNELKDAHTNDFAWQLYVKDLSDYGAENYSKALLAIPKDKETIGTLYDAFHASSGRPFPEYEFNNPHLQLVEFVSINIKVIARLIYFVAAFNALVAFLIILHLHSSTVSLERRHIGLYRAYGATKANIFALFFKETLTLTICSTIVCLLVVFLMPALINWILAKEFFFIANVLTIKFWHIVLLILGPFSISTIVLSIFLSIPLKKEPARLLKIK